MAGTVIHLHGTDGQEVAPLLSSGQLKTAELRQALLSQFLGLSRRESNIVDLNVGPFCSLLRRFLLAR